MSYSRTTIALLAFLPASLVLAQTPASTQPAPVSYTSVTELNQIISSLQQASQAAQNDLSRLRVEKWKTDSDTKRQTQHDASSILGNLQNALPSILEQLKNSPENLALTFKVYRNLDALYDVMNSVVELAGAFGSKDEFQSLNKDLRDIDSARRAFADRMDKLASVKDNEIGQLRVELQNARAAAPPKKTVVDDTEPAAKKPVRKKPAPKPKTANPAQSTPPSSQPQQQQH